MSREHVPDLSLSHRTYAVNGTDLHAVSAGTDGSPVLLVHGFPESWWAFHRVIVPLARKHRVVAVDLRGFGDSRIAEPGFDSSVAAEDLFQLVQALGGEPVHLVAQDISGGAAFRLAAMHPEVLLSFTAVEMGLAGFGLEAFADVTHGGSWHIGLLAAPGGVGEMLLAGHEVELLGRWAFPSMTAVEGAVTADDVAEMARGYARPGGWRGAIGLYGSMLAEGEELRELARTRPLRVPVLAVGAGGGDFTATTLDQVAEGEVRRARLPGVGHYAALEAPGPLAEVLLGFWGELDER